MILAETITESADFLKSWLNMGLLVLVVAVQLIALRRKPSVDVDFQRHDGRLTLVEAEVKQARTELRLLFNFQRETAEALTNLREVQSGNTANISDIKRTVHELKDDAARDDNQRTAQLAALTQRIDALIASEHRRKA